MRVFMIAAASLCLVGQAGFAQSGDAAKGEKDFRACRTCHSIIADDGTVIVKGGQVGPDLWGLPGRTAGTYKDFSYSDAMVSAGEKGLVWNEEEFTKYVQDPTAYLREYTGDSSARAKMSFKLRKADEAPDLWAYLVSVSPGGS